MKGSVTGHHAIATNLTCNCAASAAGGADVRWYGVAAVRRSVAITTLVASTALLATACGGGTTGANQSKGSGTYQVSVNASWPKLQRIDKEAVLVIDITNTGDREIPQATVTLTTGVSGTAAPAFSNVDTQPGLAEHSKSIWFLDVPPINGETAMANSWSLGSIAPGATAHYVWRIRPLVSGVHTINWKVAPAMLGGTAVLVDGSEAAGILSTVISSKAPSAKVDPKTGKVSKNFGKNPNYVPPSNSGGASPDAATGTDSGSGGADVPSVP